VTTAQVVCITVMINHKFILLAPLPSRKECH